MRILICDDEPRMLEQLQSYILQFFTEAKSAAPEIVTYFTGDDLLQDSGDKDLVFLDIEMPGVDGIYVGNTLKTKYPNAIIIIVTSFIEYLDDAMRFHVFRYLSKPLDKNRLFRNLKEALQLYNSRDITICIETKDKVISISTSDIICVEAQMKKVTVYTTNGDYESIQNMQYWTSTLNLPCFYHSHRSFIVNLFHVTDFDKTLIHLHNNRCTAYLTRRKYTDFRSKYLIYLESIR